MLQEGPGEGVAVPGQWTHIQKTSSLFSPSPPLGPLRPEAALASEPCILKKNIDIRVKDSEY